MRATSVVDSFIINDSGAVVRYAKEDDLEAVLEAVRDHLRDPAAMGGKRGRISQKRRSWWQRQLVTGKEAGRVTLLAEIDNEVQGAVVIGRSWDWRASYTPWWGCIIFVVRKYRHKGVGKRLLRSAIFEAKRVLQAREIGLMVAKPNIHAYKLYRDFGFQREAIVRKGQKWHGKNVDWVVMVKRL